MAAKFCEGLVDKAKVPLELIADQCELVCAYFMSFVVDGTIQTSTETGPHLQRYIEWAQYQFHKLKLDSHLIDDSHGSHMFADEIYCEQHMASICESSPEGELCVTIGRKLPEILRGELDPLDVLFTGQLAQNFNSSPTLNISYSKIAVCRLTCVQESFSPDLGSRWWNGRCNSTDP